MIEFFTGIGGAFLMGLFSTVHCMGMCGGIMGVLAINVPNNIGRWYPQFPYLLAYNMGRILTYSLIGAATAGATGVLSQAVSPHYGHAILMVIAASLMASMGLYLAGWFPGFAQVERLGRPMWRRLEPLGRRFLPPRSPWHALLLGGIWGWLPCGMVYSLVVFAAASGDAVAGAMYMLGFGLGTLPGVLGAGLIVGAVRMQRQLGLRRLAGMAMLTMAIGTLLFPVFYTGHSGHDDQAPSGHLHHQH